MHFDKLKPYQGENESTQSDEAPLTQRFAKQQQNARDQPPHIPSAMELLDDDKEEQEGNANKDQPEDAPAVDPPAVPAADPPARR